ncbi:uncharacterized protein LOC115321031 [Rhizophagus irregularis DAOM 181602=DAOM 197198]|nr:uncharacterized protein LOC115321031 [Rhizophagus irregularis DAOM 181602=DAOM 197198]
MLSKLIQRTIEVYFTFEIPSKTVKRKTPKVWFQRGSHPKKPEFTKKINKDFLKKIFKKTHKNNTFEDLTNIRTISPTAKRGSAWEVKLRYPEKLHPSHSDFPFSPERRIAKCEELSRYQNKLIEKLSKVETEN